MFTKMLGPQRHLHHMFAAVGHVRGSAASAVIESFCSWGFLLGVVKPGQRRQPGAPSVARQTQHVAGK